LVGEAFGADPGVAFHSFNLPNHDYKRLSEADFVLVRPACLLVIEVKGGKVSVDKGVWRFENGRGDAIKKAESPWRQAESGMWAVSKLLTGAGLKLPPVVGYAVAFPFTNWPKGKMPELPDELVIDRSDCQSIATFEQAIVRIEEFWKSRTEVSGRKVMPVDVTVFADALRPTFHAVESLDCIARDVDEESAQLTLEQIVAFDAIVANPRIVLEGPAGTGKTLLCVAWANAAVRDGLKVALVAPTAGLRSLLAKSCPGAEVLSSEDVATRARSGEMFACGIVDEGQCMGTAEFLGNFDRMIEGGLARGRWRWAMDRINQLDAPMEDSILEELRSHSIRCDLSANLRSARPIVEQLRLMLGADMQVGKLISFGVTPRFDDVQSARLTGYAKQVIGDWLDQGVKPSDITVIAPIAKLDELSAAIPGSTREAERRLDSVLLTDANSFRGLESAWILVVLDDPFPDGSELTRWLYLSMSRARVALTLLIGSRARDAVAKLERVNFVR
jgi:hypothetical protein